MHQAQPGGPFEAVLRRAAACVSQYRDDLGSLIADERRDQTAATWVVPIDAARSASGRLVLGGADTD